jgi:hypothetical protein
MPHWTRGCPSMVPGMALPVEKVPRLRFRALRAAVTPSFHSEILLKSG